MVMSLTSSTPAGIAHAVAVAIGPIGLAISTVVDTVHRSVAVAVHVGVPYRRRPARS